MSGEFKVDFIGVGFSRCGTTWISKCLEEHPEICFSTPKETHFFANDVDYEKGPRHYSSFFKCDGTEKIIGEYSPEYFLYDETMERIKRDQSDAKIIFTVRNPVDRLFSQYLYKQRKNGKKYPINDLFEKESNRREDQLLDFGMYYKHISKWIKNIPEDQYIILVHDDSKKDPKKFIQNIYKFLGVDDGFVPESLNQEVNTTKAVGYKSMLIQRIFANRIRLRKNRAGRLIIEFLKLFGIGKLCAYIASKNYKANKGPEKEKLSKEMRKKIREYYDEDIKKLEKLIKRDLSFWV